MNIKTFEIMKSILLISLCFLCSCGTSKRSTETERHVSTNLNLSDSLIRKDSTMSLEQLLSSERLQAHIIITEWSKPDSLGNQHPTKTTEIDLDREKAEDKKKEKVSGSEATRVKKEDTNIQEDDKKKDDAETDTRMIPTWVWWFLGVGGVIAALLYWHSRRKK